MFYAVNNCQDRPLLFKETFRNQNCFCLVYVKLTMLNNVGPMQFVVILKGSFDAISRFILPLECNKLIMHR